MTESKNFMRDRLESEELRDKVAKCMSEIHSYMLNECRQISWTGSNPEREIKITQTKMVEKKFQPKETVPKTISISMPNWPYSKNILQELIKLGNISFRVIYKFDLLRELYFQTRAFSKTRKV